MKHTYTSAIDCPHSSEMVVSAGFGTTKTAKLVLLTVLPDTVDSGFGETKTAHRPADVGLLSDALQYAGTCNDCQRGSSRGLTRPRDTIRCGSRT